MRISLLLLGATALFGCQAEIASGLGSAQADEVIHALDGAGIGATREAEPGQGEPTYRVSVARGDVASALAILASEELPREPTPGFEAWFAESSLVPSADEERARYAAAVSGELARSIETMAGVERARVHLAVPDPNARPLDAAPASPRASVLVQYEGSAPDERAIRDLLTGAVDGLDLANVTVVLEPRPTPAPATAQLVSVGPIAVSRGTADLLRVILASSFALNLLLIAVLAWARRPRREKAPSPPEA